ncbi:MAG: DNA repair protein RecN [candidate division WOR-3 bacterium]
MKLISLRVENFILVAEARIALSGGFNVLTGETGAGKTMLLSAISAILGARIDWESFGQRNSVVEAIFSSGKETITVRREISGKSKKSRAFFNGEPVTGADLCARLSTLVAIHGQRENQRLLDPENHLGFVDAFGKLSDLREAFASAWRKRESLRTLLEKTKKEQEAIREAEELYRFQLREIEEAGLREGEEEELAERRRVLSEGARLAEAINRALYAIQEEEGSALSDTAYAISSLSDFSDISRIREAIDLLHSSKDALSEAARVLVALRDGIHYDPEELDSVNQRLFKIARLKEKFRTDLPGLLRIAGELRAKLEKLQTSDEEIIRLERELSEAERELNQLGQALSERRRGAAAELSKRVEEELRELAMSEARFRAEVWRDEPSERGFDRSEFLFSANPGQALLPLVKVASGGELSRVMLALETALAEAEDTPILVFDEVDQGIGGRVAEIVGKKLKALSSHHQILTVTHLPQIAASADAHFIVEKKGSRVSIRLLSHEERVREIARMSAGERITPEAIALAKRLLGVE